MYIRKLRRKCEVRKCNNKDTFAISRSREAGNTIIVCRECLKEALAEIEKQYPEAKTVAVAEVVETPVAAEEAVADETSNGEGDTEPSEDELLNGMTVKELKAFAVELGIDTTNCKLRSEFIDAIKAETAKRADEE